MAKFANILETVGNTPVVRINKLAPAHVNLFVKIEAFNPLGSVISFHFENRGLASSAERSAHHLQFRPHHNASQFGRSRLAFDLPQ